MTDQNPYLDPDDEQAHALLKDAFEQLRNLPDSDEAWKALDPELRAVMEEAQAGQAHRMGATAGKMFAAIGSNVAMAYFHAGKVYADGIAKHRHHMDPGQHSTAFYDGFTSTYYVDVTDKQKEGPYS